MWGASNHFEMRRRAQRKERVREYKLVLEVNCIAQPNVQRF